MEEQKLKALISKYNSGNATPEEIQLVENWYDSLNGPELSKSDDELAEIKKGIYNNLSIYIGTSEFKKYPVQNKKVISFNYVKWIAAAILLLTISITFYYYKQYSAQNSDTITQNDIGPGANKATLILSDGSILALDDSKNGQLARQGQTVVQKTGNGLLTYLSSSKTESNEVTYNTITTPRGGQFNIILPDGTHVWLNAASSLKFPTAFAGKERNVELTGEAYFEVRENKTMPFHVSSAGQAIEVLGTHFNVNAYADETSVKTSLFQGSVKVTKDNMSAILKPGQQSSADNNTVIKITEITNPDEIIGWKNGKFSFKDTDIKMVMRQIGRWYDVDIVYAGKIPDDDVFTGTFSRKMSAANALKVLEFSGVDFKIEGRKIIVK